MRWRVLITEPRQHVCSGNFLRAGPGASEDAAVATLWRMSNIGLSLIKAATGRVSGL
jgi:hypothetical protein